MRSLWLRGVFGFALLLFASPDCRAQLHILKISSSAGLVGDQVQVSNLYTNNSNFGVQGYSWSNCIGDSDVIDIVSVTEGADSSGGTGPAAFFATAVFSGMGWNVGAITSFESLVLLESGTTEAELAMATYEILTEGSSFVEWCNVMGSPPTPTLVVDMNAVQFVPAQLDGVISIATPFIRGDVDNDGSFVGLIDGIFLLNYQFTGGATPPCLQAADLDGNGEVVGLVDGVYALAFQFTGGPPPPAPGLTCGIDPTAVIGCLETTCP